VTCNISGDPHITTFDLDVTTQSSVGRTRSTVDYQGLGVYTLVESTAGLRIQGSYFQCWPSVTCVGGVSIQYNAVTFVVSVQTIGDAPTALNLQTIGTATSGTSAVFSEDRVCAFHFFIYILEYDYCEFRRWNASEHEQTKHDFECGYHTLSLSLRKSRWTLSFLG
jgi:hypothetical protein